MRHKSRMVLAALIAVFAGSALSAAPALASGSPSVETKPATNITETGATLNGAVNPNGAETKYYFEYGTTTSYGKKTVEASAGSGTKNLEESAAITGLAVNTMYHFRIVATSTNGTSDGADKEFVATPKAGLQEFVPGEGGFPITLEGSSATAKGAFENEAGAGWLGTCEGVNIKGDITGAKALSLTLELTHCKKPEECHTVGAAKGTEVLSGNASLVYIDKAKKEVGVLLTQSTSEILCGSAKDHVRGSIVIPVTPIDTKTTKFGLILNGNGSGKQEYTSYENEKGEVKQAFLETNVGSGYQESDLDVGAELGLTASKALTISG